MAEIRWTEEAVSWLQEINDYLSQNNPPATQRVVDGIYDRAQILKKYPKIGYKYRDEPEGEIRILLYGHYRMVIKEIIGKPEIPLRIQYPSI